MPLTAKQRARINRQNAQKSTGPKSDEGKAASRRNATKHGLRAEVLSLPDEDPKIAASRAEAWNDHYQPRSPGAQHLVNECVSATLLADRCHKYHNAALSQQIRNARLHWDTQRQDAVEALAVLIQTDPAQAVYRLKQSTHGLRWLIQQWERLQTALDERGQWTNPERDQAIRLQGFRPEPEQIRVCPQAWLMRLYALLCHEAPTDQAIQFLFEERHLPELYRRQFRANHHPSRQDCQTALRVKVAKTLDELRETEIMIQRFDGPDRDEAGDRALILQDPASARLFLRYHSEARNAFHRSFSALLKTLERDAATEEADSPPSAAPESAPAPPADPVSPNEAEAPDEPDVTPQEPSISVESSEPIAASAASIRSADPVAIGGERRGPIQSVA